MPVNVYYRLEWLVPPENAIGGAAYWSAINDGVGFPYRDRDVEKAREHLAELRRERHEVRLVKVTEEVIG